jgi:hypothetical protein
VYASIRRIAVVPCAFIAIIARDAAIRASESRITFIARALVAVVAADWRVEASNDRVTREVGAEIAILAVDVLVLAAKSGFAVGGVASIDGACNIGVRDLAGADIAGILGAVVAVADENRGIRAAAVAKADVTSASVATTTGVDGAGVVVLAAVARVLALEVAVAVVDCAGIVVIAVNARHIASSVVSKAGCGFAQISGDALVWDLGAGTIAIAHWERAQVTIVVACVWDVAA